MSKARIKSPSPGEKTIYEFRKQVLTGKVLVDLVTVDRRYEDEILLSQMLYLEIRNIPYFVTEEYVRNKNKDKEQTFYRRRLWKEREA